MQVPPLQPWTLTQAANDTGCSSLFTNDPCGGDICGLAKIAVIDPTLTAAAYDNSSFYNFLENTRLPQPEKSKDDMNLLPNVIPSKSRQQSTVEGLARRLSSSEKRYNVIILDDADVHEYLILSWTWMLDIAYDILIIFHNEYVTPEEYKNITTFVANGGNLFVMDGNMFYAEAKIWQEYVNRGSGKKQLHEGLAAGDWLICQV
jgi:hypothetical protein